MERKYMVIFLVGLLCLIGSDDLSAQYCISLRYDNNGNRMNFAVANCAAEQRDGNEENIETEEISEQENDDENDLIVYPNPNDGNFKIQIKDEDCTCMCAYQVYDSKGVMVKSDWFVKTTNIDIGNNPPGVYLLRIIKDGIVGNRIVVKL